MDEIELELPASALQAIARGETMAIDLPEIDTRLVITCSPEAVQAFRDAIHAAMMTHLQPASGVH